MLHRTWDGEAVIYDTFVGSTHHIDAFTTAVLGFLSTEPASAEVLARHLLAELDTDHRADVLAAVREALAKLRDMDLIQPADS